MSLLWRPYPKLNILNTPQPSIWTTSFPEIIFIRLILVWETRNMCTKGFTFYCKWRAATAVLMRTALPLLHSVKHSRRRHFERRGTWEVKWLYDTIIYNMYDPSCWESSIHTENFILSGFECEIISISKNEYIVDNRCYIALKFGKEGYDSKRIFQENLHSFIIVNKTAIKMLKGFLFKHTSRKKSSASP